MRDPPLIVELAWLKVENRHGIRATVEGNDYERKEGASGRDLVGIAASAPDAQAHCAVTSRALPTRSGCVVASHNWVSTSRPAIVSLSQLQHAMPSTWGLCQRGMRHRGSCSNLWAWPLLVGAHHLAAPPGGLTLTTPSLVDHRQALEGTSKTTCGTWRV